MTINHLFVHYLPAHHDETSATIVRGDGLCSPARETQSVSIPLTALDLQTRYGDPDVQRFVVRPAITLMAEYSPDHTACRMLLAREVSILRSDEPAKYSSTRGLNLSRRAAIYVRCSTAEQETDLQETELQEYVEKRGWTYVVYRDKGQSGAKNDRPALNTLLNDLRRRKIDVLVVWVLDRRAP